MTVRGGPDHCGTVGTLSLKIVLFIWWMRTRRRAAVSSLGSGWNWELTSMMKAEVTAENRPACGPIQHQVSLEKNAVLTNISVVFRSSSYLFMNSLSYSSATLR